MGIVANVEIKKAINKPNVQSDFKMKILTHKNKVSIQQRKQLVTFQTHFYYYCIGFKRFQSLINLQSYHLVQRMKE